jgi:exopolysaccharide production protein ExoZ
VAGFFFVPAFDTDGNIFPPVVPGWSLTYELYFYIVCTCILALVPRRRFLLAVSFVIIALIVAMLPWTLVPVRSLGFAPLVLFLPLSLEFVAGMVLAHLYERGLRTNLPLSGILTAAGLIWLFAVPASDPYEFSRVFLWGPPAVALTWAVLACEEKLPFYKVRSGLVLGDASYALYICHPVVLAVFFRGIGHLHVSLSAWLTIPVVVAASAVASVLVHLYIERRTVRAASRLLGITYRPQVQVGMNSDALRPL